LSYGLIGQAKSRQQPVNDEGQNVKSIPP